MSYLVQEPANFINIKLTDTGRRLLSLGVLTFNKIILSDREINYNMGRNGYDLCYNRVLAPKDDQPKFGYNFNFDGSNPTAINGQNLVSARQIVTAMTNSTGFFSGGTDGLFIKTSAASGQGQPLGTAIIDYTISSPDGGAVIGYTNTGYSAQTGDLVYIPWEPPQYSGITNSGSTVFSGRPNVSLWYRIQSASTSTMTLDRSIPNFGTSPIGTAQQIKVYFYPFDAVKNYYGSATTTNCGIWNMNIVRTSSEIGTTPAMSGYTVYGSIDFNGTKQYLGFDNDTKAFGIVHYTNKYSGNTYAEQFVPGTVQLEIPNIMWHKRFTTQVGQELNYGITLYDSYGSNVFDSVAQTDYRDLRDGTSSASNIVGRVYHKLKIIIITDQELLTALTYKSNRNFTLPEVNYNLMPSNALPSATGLCKSDYSYYVTYVVSSNPYSATTSYGYPQSLPCGYVKKITGQNDSNNLPSVLAISFPSFAFPFMRKSADLATLSGTGWNANSVQILLQEIVTSASTLVGDLPTNNWKLISTEIGNGIYTGETGEGTIAPQSLQSHVFMISQQDYDSGTTYSLSGQFSAFTSNINYLNSNGLAFGNETFFYGNLTTGIQANVYKTLITVFARNDEFNSSTYNSTFNSLYDSNTFITEIGILNSNDELVGVAKPSYPILKNESRYLAFQLELDF